MIKFATSFARSGFGLGVAIGLMVTIHLHSFVQAMPMTADDTSCDTVLDVSPEVQAFVDLQCLVNGALFNDGLEPSTTYAIDTAVEQPGTYTGATYDGRAVSLEAIMVIESDLVNEAPELIEAGVSSYLVIGTLSGSVGDVRIAGTVMLTGTITPDDEFLLLVFDVLTEEEYAVFDPAAQIMSGVQTLDLDTFIIEPLSTSHLSGAAWASANGPATLLHQDQAGGAGAGVSVTCVNNAYEDYRIAVNNAMDDVARCMARAKRNLAFCLGACAATLLVPVFSLVVTGVCAVGCLSFGNMALMDCTDDYNLALSRAMQTLTLALQRCGVRIV